MREPTQLRDGRTDFAALVVAGCIIGSLAAVLAWQAPDLAPQQSAISMFSRQMIVAGNLIAGVAFLASCLFLRRPQPRGLVLWVVLVGLVCRLVLLPAPPVLATDYQRYLWDGAVCVHGYNPWRFSPAAVLAGTSAGIPAGLHHLAVLHRHLVAKINHADLPTIYPPASEAAFAAAALIAPFNIMAWKAILLLFDAATAVVIALTLRRLKLPPGWLLIYWWNPVVINAFANEAHLDAIAVFFAAAFVYLLVCGRSLAAAVALGLAIGAKFWPLVLVLVLVRACSARRRVGLGAVMITMLVALLTLSPMLLTGPRAWIGVSAYARYWQANDLLFHLLFVLWQRLCHSWSEAHLAAVATVLVLFAGGALALLKRPVQKAQAAGVCLMLVALIFLLSPTEFPWYYTWLVPMLAVCPRPSLLVWACTLGLYHLSFVDPHVVWIEHLPVIALLILEALVPRLRTFFQPGQSPWPALNDTPDSRST